MRFSPGFFGSLLTGSSNWEINLDDHDLQIRARGNLATRIDYPSISAVNIATGVVWSTIHIQSCAHSFKLDGIANGDADILQSNLIIRITESLSRALSKNHRAVQHLVDALDALVSLPQFLAHRDITQWLSRLESTHENSVKETVSVLRHPYASKDVLPAKLQDGATKLLSVLSGDPEAMSQRNRLFVEGEMQAHKVFLDSVEKTPLTREQRVAAIIMEDRNLLVAAAGSGKTSTVVGKIGYALLKGLMTPKEILVLAFNNHAARELEERIQERLAPLLGECQIKVKTFHALGMEVIAETTGKKPSIANFAGGGEAAASQLMSDLVESLQANDPSFAVQWLFFLSLCRSPAKNPAAFESVLDWQNYVRETGDYQNGKSGYLTLNRELVKSQGELAIANWLFMNGVEYEYERPYQYETADKKFRQYKPDFYFPAIGCYLEHYALDAKGNPPKAFGEKYRESMLWKRNLHQEKGTDVFETTFAEFVSGELFDKLEKELTSRGIELKPRNREEILERLNQPKLSAELSSLLRTFIKHAKSNELSESSLISRACAMPHPYRARLFASIASKVMGAYEKKIQSQGDVDFEDLIVDAAHHAAGEKFTHPYKLILVDEFQDISRARAKLLLSFLGKEPECKLFAVGDDWQSIYRFAGSDIAIFTEFEKIFGYAATNYLTQTFRSNQGIADIASGFVQRNPGQLRKKVEAQDKTIDDVVVIRRYERLQEVEGLVETMLVELDGELKTAKEPVKVFILGRYRHQSPEKLEKWQKRFAANLEIEFRTIHASKGLQADYVILIGLHARKNAFPAEIADDPLLQMVMPNPETFPHSEERRLFYVALTRARHRVYLLGGKHTPSCFLAELPSMASTSIESAVNPEEESLRTARCPRCEVGRLQKRHGKHGLFLGCSEYPNCNYTRNINR